MGQDRISLLQSGAWPNIYLKRLITAQGTREIFHMKMACLSEALQGGSSPSCQTFSVMLMRVLWVMLTLGEALLVTY